MGNTLNKHVVDHQPEQKNDPIVTLQMLAGANIDFPDKPLNMPEEQYTANCARASWLLDKLTKNYLLRCWKARAQIVGKMRLEGGRLISEVGERLQLLDSRPSTVPYTFRAADVRRRKRWQRYMYPTSFHCSSSDRKGPWNFYVVTRGRRLGVFYRWLDVKRAMAGLPGALCRGYSTLSEAERAYESAAKVWL